MPPRVLLGAPCRVAAMSRHRRLGRLVQPLLVLDACRALLRLQLRGAYVLRRRRSAAEDSVMARSV